MPRFINPKNSFITTTFAESVENHAGMQMIGEKRQAGLSMASLEDAAKRAEQLSQNGTHNEPVLYSFKKNGEEASVLVIPGGIDLLLGKGAADKLEMESRAQPFDTKFLNTRRNMVMEKHGRQNNCYADEAQEPDIPQGKGTVVAFDTAPQMKQLREALPSIFGPDAKGLFAETNFYTDVTKREVGIGFHGDTERSIVIGARLGAASLPLRFQWYQNSLPISKEHAIELKHGDLYAMSHKATGHDWLKKKVATLRHGVGRKAIVKKPVCKKHA